MDYCDSLLSALHTSTFSLTPALPILYSEWSCQNINQILFLLCSTSSDFLIVAYNVLWKANPASHHHISPSLFYVILPIHSASLVFLVYTKCIHISGPLNLISLPGTPFLRYAHGFIQMSGKMLLFYQRGLIILCFLYSALFFIYQQWIYIYLFWGVSSPARI